MTGGAITCTCSMPSYLIVPKPLSAALTGVLPDSEPVREAPDPGGPLDR